MAFFLLQCACNQNAAQKPEHIISGEFSWEDWQMQAGWESYSSDDYKPDKKKIYSLKNLLGANKVSFLLVGANWCGDSKEQMPKIYKLFKLTSFPLKNVKLVGVDRDKEDPEGIAPDNDIERAPTLIVIKNGIEIGRIVETPDISWEDDILNILSKTESEK